MPSPDTTTHTDDLLSSVAAAIDAEVYRQYQVGENRDEAKDVLECLDYCRIASAALAAQSHKPEGNQRPCRMIRPTSIPIWLNG
jgi:hypothetical protein